jgi:hypothetical protein
MATLPIKKQDAHVKAPSNVADLNSGMQRATANGGIGVIVTASATTVPGADIRAAVDARLPHELVFRQHTASLAPNREHGKIGF